MWGGCMTVKKQANGSYQARFQFDGKRYKKSFPSSREARAWEADTLRELAAGNTPIVQKDRRRFSELVELWFKLHGHTLKDGKRRLSRLHHIAKLMDDPLARQMGASQFSQYRAVRLGQGSSENNCNRELSYIKALFNELIRHDEWRQDNPVANVRKIKFDEKDMRYLNKEEIELLLAACKKSKSDSLYKVVEICLRTGARWGEANFFSPNDIKIDGDRAWIRYEGTKSGKVRTIPVEASFARYIRGNKIGSGILFKDCLSAFRRAIEKANIDLPAGQATHVLRHTFASHYMMKGGDLLKLQKLLGHSTVVMTMRYAHLAPNALEDVLDKHALS